MLLTARLPGVRARILAIALVPSLVSMVIGVATAVALVRAGEHAGDFAETLETKLGPARELVLAVDQERLLSLWQLAGEQPKPGSLTAARVRLDAAIRTFVSTDTAFQPLSGARVANIVDGFTQLQTQLPVVRGGIDTGAMPLADAYTFYSRLLDGVSRGAVMIESNVPDVDSGIALNRILGLLRVLEAISRTTALTAAAAGPAGLPPALFTEYRTMVGYYHAETVTLVGELDDAAAGRLRDLTASRAWQQVSAMEEAVIHPAPGKPGLAPALPMSIADWRSAADQVNSEVVAIWGDQNKQARQQAADTAARQSRDSLLTGAAVSGAAVLAFLLSLWLANRLIGRLRRLRSETLALAEIHLPETMRRLSESEAVDPETEAARLEFGRDEIGQVAQAFNRAHTAAVTAAVEEARTRDGVRAVFLNMAHRSQLVVHRQLAILDEAERRQEDPAVLETFFRLDHLATRERRNAENLIILAGGRPGRRWRRPVPLGELVRSAVAETLDYVRVHTGRLPQVFLVGEVVADLVHLLAELVDNATAFSPPESAVDVTGNLIGKGAVIEISDQGMGMTEQEMGRANDMLARPPDFGVATLSADSGLGLFVVARLGARHGISVRLSESDYGGVRAIVLLPSALIVAGPDPVDHPHGDSTPPGTDALRERPQVRAEVIGPPQAAAAATDAEPGWSREHTSRPALPRRRAAPDPDPTVLPPASQPPNEPEGRRDLFFRE
ncbi:sensor histidine kinase [Nocardia abscessus]|uniref:sensor histidine kinase n=1 Tax=Nocardia abscessus TaxID=120957 RepID=UPI0024570E91|nr:nitrate- and nitrite sensing domain-containing protein [Nocardia abscessus]